MSNVFRDKNCTIELIDPHFGQNGFQKDCSGEVTMFFWDKGGQERKPKEEGGGFSKSEPGFVVLEEFKRRKAARARFWKKTAEGQRDYLFRQSRGGGAAERGSLYPYGEDHPHALA